MEIQMQIPTDDFIAFVGSLENQELSTLARRKKFTVKMLDGGLEFTPAKTKVPRRHRRTYDERVLAHFQQTVSLKNKDYKFTVNQSYMLALIDRYLKARHVA